MSQISENLFSAIDIILDQRLSQLSFDKTMPGIIEQVDARNSSKFYIRANGVLYTAYGNPEYKKGDQVYIMTPQNDEAVEKIIVGRLSAPQRNSVASSLENSLVIYKRLNMNDLSIEVEDFVTMPKKFIFSANINIDNATTIEGEIKIKFIYASGENEVFIFNTNDFFGTVSSGDSTYQEKIFDILQPQELSSIEISPSIFTLENISLIFGDSIEDYSGDQVIIKTVNKLTYFTETQKELYFSYLIYNKTGLVQKINPQYIQWQRYLITSGSNESIDTYWGRIGEASLEDGNISDVYNLSTIISRPYDKIRANIGGIASNIITFSNSSWSADDPFEESIVVGSNYSLIVNMQYKDDEKGAKNVITRGYGGEYLLKAAIRDSYSNSEIVNNEGLASFIKYELLYSKNISLNGNKIIPKNNSDIATGIVKASCIYNGILYENYISIGWRIDNQYASFHGPTVVTYNAQGAKPAYDSSSYEIYSPTNQLFSSLTWGVTHNQPFYPALNTENVLIPSGTYIEGLEKGFSVIAKNGNSIIWQQPIIIRKEGSVEASKDLELSDGTQINNSILNLLYLITEMLNGIVIGQANDDKTGVFGVVDNKKVFELTNKTINILDKYLRLDLEDNESSVRQINSEAYVTNGTAADAGFQLDLKNNKFTTPFATFGNKDDTTIIFASDSKPHEEQDNFLVTLGFLREKGIITEEGENG